MNCRGYSLRSGNRLNAGKPVQDSILPRKEMPTRDDQFVVPLTKGPRPSRPRVGHHPALGEVEGGEQVEAEPILGGWGRQRIGCEKALIRTGGD